jgi:solute carrier family 23 (nucleobase transporter), member 1
LLLPLQVAKCIEVGLPALVLLVLFAEVSNSSATRNSHPLMFLYEHWKKQLFPPMPQYAAHFFVKGSFVFGRCAVLVTVVIVWIYAEILTAAGAYNERGPITQISCRTDRSGIIQGAPW